MTSWQPIGNKALRYTRMTFFCSRFWQLSNTYRPNNEASEFFGFCSWIRPLIQIFWHSAVTQLTQSLIPRQLSPRQVRLHINWVNAEWDSTSTESTRKDTIFVNVGFFCLDSVYVESHSTLTQLTESLTPRRLSVREMNQAKTGIHDRLWGL